MCEYHRQAQKELSSLRRGNRRGAEAVDRVTRELDADPRPHGCVKLKRYRHRTDDVYRLQVAHSLRIAYRVIGSRPPKVVVVYVGERGEIPYDALDARL